MFKRKLFVFLFILSVLCSACQVVDDPVDNVVNSNVTVMINDIADVDLKKTAEGLSEIYKNKPKNTSASFYENLSPKELRDLVGENVDLTGLHEISARKIGDDYFYILVSEEDDNLEKFTIYKNNEAVFGFESEPLTQYSPIVSVRVIENKYTVEYLEKMYSLSLSKFLEKKRIWQEGVGELSKVYELNNVMMPFEANGKRLFLGEKENVWRIYYDGQVLADEFASINFGYANEPALYMPKAFNYRYLVFFANQDGRSKIVEVDVGGD